MSPSTGKPSPQPTVRTRQTAKQKDICFLYDDPGALFCLGRQPTEMYDILYRHLSLQDITGGRYQYRAAK